MHHASIAIVVIVIGLRVLYVAWRGTPARRSVARKHGIAFQSRKRKHEVEFVFVLDMHIIELQCVALHILDLSPLAQSFRFMEPERHAVWCFVAACIHLTTALLPQARACSHLLCYIRVCELLVRARFFLAGMSCLRSLMLLFRPP